MVSTLALCRVAPVSELAGVCFSPDGSILFVNIYGAGKTLQAIVELITMFPRPALATGKHVTPRARLTLLSLPKANGADGRIEPIDARDRFTLPNGLVAQVLTIDGVMDPDTDAPYSVSVWVG